MAQTLKVLAQSAPAGYTLTDAYTVPTATSATVSSVVVCNQNSSGVTVRLSVAVAGAADAVAQYVAYDMSVAAKETRALTLGLTLAATDVVRVYASLSNVSFSLFGVEVT